jgi:hypothetical protein
VTPKQIQINPNALSTLKRQNGNQSHISIQSDKDDETSYSQQKYSQRYFQRVKSDSEGQVVIHKANAKRLSKSMSMPALSPIPEIHRISSNASLFPISCHCGHTGDGNEEATQKLTNDYIHCDECDMVQIQLALQPRSE